MAEKWDLVTISRAIEAIAHEAEISGTDPEDILCGVSTALAVLLARIEPESARNQMVAGIARGIPEGVRTVRRLNAGKRADPATNDNLH